jgi:hypothetical protein
LKQKAVPEFRCGLRAIQRTRPSSLRSFDGLNPTTASSPAMIIGVERKPLLISSLRAATSLVMFRSVNWTWCCERNSLAW